MSKPEPDKIPGRNIGLVGELLKKSLTTALIQAVFELSPGDRQENFNRLLKGAAPGMDYVFAEILVSQMTPAERITAFESSRKRINRDHFEGILTRLGHSPEGIARMLPEGTPH